MYNWLIGILCGFIFCVGVAIVVSVFCNDVSNDKEWKNLGHQIWLYLLTVTIALFILCDNYIQTVENMVKICDKVQINYETHTNMFGYVNRVILKAEK